MTLRPMASPCPGRNLSKKGGVPSALCDLVCTVPAGAGQGVPPLCGFTGHSEPRRWRWRSPERGWGLPGHSDGANAFVSSGARGGHGSFIRILTDGAVCLRRVRSLPSDYRVRLPQIAFGTVGRLHDRQSVTARFETLRAPEAHCGLVSCHAATAASGCWTASSLNYSIVVQHNTLLYY
jgi:hypothetical protein